MDNISLLLLPFSQTLIIIWSDVILEIFQDYSSINIGSEEAEIHFYVFLSNIF